MLVAPTGAAPLPFTRSEHQFRLRRILLHVTNSLSQMRGVTNLCVEVILLPEGTASAQDEIGFARRSAFPTFQQVGQRRGADVHDKIHPCGLNSAFRSANGARGLSRRTVRTAQTPRQNSKASFAYQHPCGLKSALRRSRGNHAKHIPYRV